MFPKTKAQFFARLKNLKDLAGFLPAGEAPIYLYNEEGRLHSEVGPAFRSHTRIAWYRNGQKHGMDADVFGSVTYYWKGVLIPESYFLDQKNLKVDQILSHSNAEVRYAGMDIYGYDRLIRHPKVKVVSRDTPREMVLYQFNSNALASPLTILQVKNSTPEHDGTSKKYFLCVPPTMTDCQEAVAWTFGKTKETYHPVLET